MSLVTFCTPAPCPVERADLSSTPRKQARVGPTQFPSPPAVLPLPGPQFWERPFPWAGIRPTGFQTPATLGVTLFRKWAKRTGYRGCERPFTWGPVGSQGTAGTKPFSPLHAFDLWTRGITCGRLDSCTFPHTAVGQYCPLSAAHPDRQLSSAFSTSSHATPAPPFGLHGQEQWTLQTG